MADVSKVIQILKKTYPDARIALNYGNNWELLVAVILSAQCTDKKVNEVSTVLWEKYRSLRLMANGLPLNTNIDTPEKQELLNFAVVPIEELEKDIKSTGFYRNKARNIQAAAQLLLEKFDGKLPRTMDEMLIIPGVARKTANVVLGNAYKIVEGIAVDTHVHRLSQRLRLVDTEKIGGGKKPVYYIKEAPAVRSPLPWSPSTRRGVATAGFGRTSDFSLGEKSGPAEKRLDYYKDASPEKIERELMEVFPKKDWFKLTYLLIDHGRAICKAQQPNCWICPVQKLCPASRV